MGAVNKIPGVSGGTVAFITGIYEELIDSITKINFSSFKKLFKEGFISFYNEINGKFLFTVFGGLIASFFSVSLLLDLIIEKYELYIYGLFFGMIVGSFYVIYNKLEKLTFRTSTALIIGFIVGMIISFADKINLGSSELIIFISGVIAISGMILPGLSGSYLLLLMGNYTLIMVDSVNSLYFSIVDLFKFDFNFIYDDERVYLLKVLFLFTTGSIFGLIYLSNILGSLLKKHKSITLALIVGFIAGSLRGVWPWKIKSQELEEIDKIAIYIPEVNTDSSLLAVVYIIIGILFVVLLEKFANKN
ncbi:MAG: DUF368 domain-containing protein [Flavobacteriaceae bacterium]|nr:DUF368 domain-containing protein [Flavobacteriaceae bacterium]